MSRFIQNQNIKPVNIESLMNGDERTDGKRWNHVQTKRFGEMLLDVSEVKNKDGLRRCERAKGAQPIPAAQRAHFERQQARRQAQREARREANKTPEQKLEEMMRSAFRQDR